MQGSARNADRMITFPCFGCDTIILSDLKAGLNRETVAENAVVSLASVKIS